MSKGNPARDHEAACNESEPRENHTGLKQLPLARQLALFEGWTLTDGNSSHTFDLDTLLPNRLGRNRKTTSLDPDVREIRLGDVFVTVTRRAAVLEDKYGKGYYAFPSAREAIVERAIRKLAVQQTAEIVLVGGRTNTREDIETIRVRFSYSQLRKELSMMNHGFKISEIREALEILTGSQFVLQCKADRVLHGKKGALLENLVTNERDGDHFGERSFVQVDYHELATAAIRQLAYYPINYARLMSLKNPLAAWLTVKMNNRYRQGDSPTIFSRPPGYHISLSTILRESGITKETRTRDNIQNVRTALNEMTSKGLLYPFADPEKIHGYLEEVKYEMTSRRPCVSDVVWTLIPSKEFADDILAGNVAMAKLRKERSQDSKRSLHR